MISFLSGEIRNIFTEKSILEINIIPIKIIKITKINFNENLPIAPSFPELVFFVNCIYFK